MKDTFSVLFFLKVSKKKSDGTLPIYVRITANGSRSEVSIKRYILKDRWNRLKCRAKGKNQESKMLGVSYSTLKSLRLKGVLPHSKIGGSIYYNHSDIINLLNENKICNF